MLDAGFEHPRGFEITDSNEGGDSKFLTKLKRNSSILRYPGLQSLRMRSKRIPRSPSRGLKKQNK